MSHSRRSASITATLLATALWPLTACGGEDEQASDRKIARAVPVVAGEYAIAMPNRIKGGVVTMDFRNSGKEPHEFALGRLQRGKTLADLRRAMAAGKEPPRWIHGVAGVPAMTPGARLSITRRLRPGTYAFLCFIPAPNGRPHFELGMARQFTVAGDSGRTPPRADGVITAHDERMDVPKVRAGRRTLELHNAASSPREFELKTFRQGKTMRDAERWFRSGFRGRAPLELVGAMQTIPAGTSVSLTTSFERGATYVVSDPDHDLEARFTAR
jgi:uncharacterized cupredoxin-like copper-binding protein